MYLNFINSCVSKPGRSSGPVELLEKDPSLQTPSLQLNEGTRNEDPQLSHGQILDPQTL